MSNKAQPTYIRIHIRARAPSRRGVLCISIRSCRDARGAIAFQTLNNNPSGLSFNNCLRIHIVLFKNITGCCPRTF